MHRKPFLFDPFQDWEKAIQGGPRKHDVWTSIEEGDEFPGKRKREGIYGFVLPQRDPMFALKE